MAASDVVRGVDNQTSGTSAATGVFITLSAPAGIAAGDQLVVGIQLREPPSTLSNWTAPAGWTLLASPSLASGTSYVYRATYGTDVTGASWTWSNGTGNTTTTRWAATLVALVGSQAGTYQQVAVQAVSGATVATPSITTTGSTLLVAFFGSRTTGGPSFTWPASWVEQGDVNTGTATNSASQSSGVYNTTPTTAGSYSVTVTPSLAVSAGYGAIVAYAATTNTSTVSAALGATGTLTATATPALNATASFSAVGTLSTGVTPKQASASFSAVGALTATATASFAQLRMTVTPDPTFSPPRVRIDIADTRTTKATSVTITRTDEAGQVYPVRTSDGGPLPLSNGAATIWDYEAPFGQNITYATNVTGGPVVKTTLTVARPWLVHPGVPTTSVTFRMARGSSLPAKTWVMSQGVFDILGRSAPIVVTGGARTAPASSLAILTTNEIELAAVMQVLSDGSPLLLNTPSGYGLSAAYIAAGNVTVSRVSPIVSDPYRTVEFTYQVVDRPAGGTQAAITWASLTSTTWAGIPVKAWNAVTT